MRYTREQLLGATLEWVDRYLVIECPVTDGLALKSLVTGQIYPKYTVKYLNDCIGTIISMPNLFNNYYEIY